jgi:hypothetical protein
MIINEKSKAGKNLLAIKILSAQRGDEHKTQNTKSKTAKLLERRGDDGFSFQLSSGKSG